MSQIDDRNGGAGERRPLVNSGARDLGGLAIAVGLFLFAALIAWDGATYPERRSYAQFGPEIFPYLVAAGLAVFGVATVVMALRKSFPERERMNIAAVAWVIGAVVAETVLLYAGAGFIVGSGALFGLAARGMGRRPLWLTILVGIGVSALLYVLFKHGLSLSLPAGPIERVIDGALR
ncbi:tripartite tricarboxylate transporter TctB family protein [Pelagibacterium halotolerans]|uniref:Tricarboxylate transport protein TctB n=1 Tax=Pelagibacterium halotolerans (strain DSM 22347 / JCM 15775 / CGMCC 1.7692 / B2) TaxID=1082931 RepID=G4RD43_PELHB|nr:tripartite tricarboxylate transporter TctB family protein [Pelagibacterium halotolerans]AEQ53793.1 tricarboxylate transport protein TctB [Pelagibacterium halotolerans B2]QJR20050.1 tripartite tricarboxylate transporter TctB family protein [Pelagibacterium halotolerans]SEA81129.1 putative tricarboxylic transport membrane protein [Pelagibacterium halotolerans]